MLEPSVSNIAIKILAHGKGEALADLLRHLSPMTVNAVKMKLPIYGRVNRPSDALICIISQIVAGLEKSQSMFKKGDLAFMPLNGSICIFLKDTRTARPMNHLGHISSGLDVLENLGTGDTVSIELV
jgi:hypothetical protein